jgi:hypothetical protein
MAHQRHQSHRLLALLAGTVLAASISGASVETSDAARTWRPHLNQAVTYLDHRAGAVSFAVRTESRRYGYRAFHRAPPVSVIKAMFLVAYLRHVRHRPLRRADLRLLTPMVRWSNDVAASRVVVKLGSWRLAKLARLVGMPCFALALPVWGNSRSCAAEQARLFLRIDRYVPARHRRVALRLLGSIVPSQRWGVARARPRGWALYFKGGWGSSSGGADHQAALLRRGRRRLGLAIFTLGNPSHAYAKETLRGVARRLLEGLGPDAVPG